MPRFFPMSIFRRVTLALVIVAAVTAPAEASIFGSIFAKKHAIDSTASINRASIVAAEEAPQTASDEFAQRAKVAVAAVATDVLPETNVRMEQVPPPLSEHESVSDRNHDSDRDPLLERNSSVGGDSASHEVDPGLGNHVESSDRVAMVPEHVMARKADKIKPTNAASPELADMTKVFGDSDQLPMSEHEASDLVKNELEAINKPLGPEQSAEPAAAAAPPMTIEAHSALKSRVEAALASLSGVYDALRHSGVLAPAAAGPSTALHAEGSSGAPPVAVPVLSLDVSDGGVQTPESEDVSEIASGRAVAGGRAEEKVRDSGAGTNGGFATAVLSVCAGLVFVAAAGLVVAGFVFSSRAHERNSHQPLYPPTGPSFV